MITIRARTESIKLSNVDEGIFSECFYARCLEIGSCPDICCSHGCDVDRAEVGRILSFRSELEILLGIPATGWFREKIKDAEYPSGEFARARVYRGKCVFYAHRLGGCTLHRFALEKGMDAHRLKPMVCFLFPLTWEKGSLLISDFLDDLPCKEQGPSIFEAQKGELKIYLGNEFVSELEGFVPERIKQKRLSKGLDK